MHLLIYGIGGYMGKLIEEQAKYDSFWTKISGAGSKTSKELVDENYSVIVDFSHPSALDDILNLSIAKNIPLVIGTTGFNKDQLEKIRDSSKKIPILQSTNMSLGMNILFSLVGKTAKILKDKVDIEVIESHHNRKKDAPSGSARSIVESIEKGLGETRKHQHGRVGECPREKGEIGVHAIRGGNIVGYHEANFINELETIKITHEAHNRSVFAQGALEAAKFIIYKSPGLYTMKDVLDL